MKSLQTAVRLSSAVAIAAVVAVEPALAGAVVEPVPVPLLGAGIPALAAFAGGYLLIRKRRR